MQATLVGPATSPGLLLHARAQHHSAHQHHNRHGKNGPGTSEPPRRERTGDDELVWHDRQLTWSRGVQVHRRFTYDHENEDIAYAAFIKLWIGSEEDEASTSSTSSLEGKGKQTSDQPSSKQMSKPDTELRNTSKQRTFGPFHVSQYASWSLDTTGGGPSHSGPRRLVRSLVVFLQTRAHVYFPTGVDNLVHMPFVVDSVFPLDEGGAVVQRALEKRERRRLFGLTNEKQSRHSHRQSYGNRTGRDSGVGLGLGNGRGGRGSLLRGLNEEEEMSFGNQSALSALDGLIDLDESAPELPRLYTLDNLFDELKVVVEGSIERDSSLAPNQHPASHAIKSAPSSLPTPGVVGVNATLPIPSHQQLIFLSDTYLVIYDYSDGCLLFFQRLRVPSVSEPTPPPMTARTMRPQDILKEPAPSHLSVAGSGDLGSTGPGKAGTGRGRASLTRTASATVSSAADRGDRGQRRAPRSSRGVSMGMSGTGAVSVTGVDADLGAAVVGVTATAGDLQATLERDRAAEAALSAGVASSRRRSSGVGVTNMTGGRASLSSDTSRRISGIGIGQTSASFMREDAEAFRAPTSGSGMGAAGGIGLGMGLNVGTGKEGKSRGVGFDGKGGIGGVEKDLRETTMMMGLERDDEGVRSDVVLEKLFVWKVPGEIRECKDFTVFLSDNVSPSSTYLNIHIAPLDKLYIFHVQRLSQPQSLSQLSRHFGRHLQHMSLSSGIKFEAVDAVPSASAIPVLATRRNVVDTLVLTDDGRVEVLTSHGQRIGVDIPDGRDEVARKLASTLSMAVEQSSARGGEALALTAANDSGPGGGRRIVGLTDAHGSTFTAVWSDGDQIRMCLSGIPSETDSIDPLVQQCLEGVAYYLSPQVTFELKRDVLVQVPSSPSSSWDRLEQSLRHLTGLPIAAKAQPKDRLVFTVANSPDPIVRRLAKRLGKPTTRLEDRSGTSQAQPTLNTAPVMLVLHLVAQDCRLSSSRLRDMLRLVPLVIELATTLGRTEWRDYWLRLVPTAADVGTHTVSSGHDESGMPADSSILDVFPSPPDIIQYLSRRLSHRLKPFPSPNSLGHPNEFGDTQPCERTTIVCELYDKLGAGDVSPSTTATTAPGDVTPRAWATVERFVERGLGAEWLADLPPGVALPILEMLRVCQARPDKTWSRQVFNLINREDLAARCLGEKAVVWDTKQEVGGERPTIRDIMMGVGNKAASQPPVYVRFGQDRRVQEVERIMQTEQMRTLQVHDPPGANDQAIIQYHQSVVNTIANRTLSITVGQGIFEYGTRTTVITDAWNIPLIEVAVKIVPGNSVYKAQIAAEAAEWPCFHNGVSRGLSISPDCKGVDSSWIVFNRPQTFNPEHAGFLLGLGLTGHLRALRGYHAFPYLGPRHDLTSIGLLLGLGCSFAGSEDTLVTKMLSLHTHALLPLGSMELNASPIVQSTALVGLGLVFAGSRSLRMAEVALAEIGRKEMPGVEGFGLHTEAYSFSSSMAFGLIMLGRGGSNEVDRKMVAQLSRCIHGDFTDKSIDFTVTSPGATLALGLMYLRSGRKDVADVLSIPQTAIELEAVRPELLLMRTFARALIMWDTVRPSSQWFEEQFPPFIRALHGDHKRSSTMELATELAYFSIIAGACLAVGLKHAGTASEAAHNSLMFFFGVLGKAAAGQSMTYEGKIRRHAARQALNIVTIALAVTMSGTGELNVLRRLRVSHGQEGAGVTYGSHMAMHMALGILFLGRGYFTLGDSDLAIAAMSIAFFPRFVASPADNKAYPQAFRHLWALAVEPRCITARDVDTRETVYLPIKLHARQDEQQNLISPTLVAPFDTLRSIYVDSPRYWPVSYDIFDPKDRASLVQTRTIWIKRKAGYADYNVDPKGNRSIFVRAGAMTGFDMHYDLVSPAEPSGLGAAEVQELVATHSNDSNLVALTNLFSTDQSTSTSLKPAQIDSFVRAVLLECLSLDKPKILSVYLDLYLGISAGASNDEGGSGDGLELVRKSQLSLIRQFLSVSEKQYTAPPTPGEKRFSLLRPSFISALWRRSPLPPSEETRVRYWTQGAWPTDSESQRLAAFLTRRSVPPASLLAALAERVREHRATRMLEGSEMESGEEGMSAEEVEEQVVAMRVRDAARGYMGSLTAQWDEVGIGGQEGAWWDASSVDEAVGVWR